MGTEYPTTDDEIEDISFSNTDPESFIYKIDQRDNELLDELNDKNYANSYLIDNLKDSKARFQKKMNISRPMFKLNKKDTMNSFKNLIEEKDKMKIDEKEKL